MFLCLSLLLHFHKLAVKLFLYALEFNNHSLSWNPRFLIKREMTLFKFRMSCPSSDNSPWHHNLRIPIQVKNVSSVNMRDVIYKALIKLIIFLLPQEAYLPIVKFVDLNFCTMCIWLDVSSLSYSYVYVSQRALLRARLTGALSKGGKMHGVATNVYLWETSEKPEETAQNENSKFGSCIYAWGRY